VAFCFLVAFINKVSRCLIARARRSQKSAGVGLRSDSVGGRTEDVRPFAFSPCLRSPSLFPRHMDRNDHYRRWCSRFDGREIWKCSILSNAHDPTSGCLALRCTSAGRPNPSCLSPPDPLEWVLDLAISHQYSVDCLHCDRNLRWRTSPRRFEVASSDYWLAVHRLLSWTRSNSNIDSRAILGR
jgi:hypothetical protein